MSYPDEAYKSQKGLFPLVSTLTLPVGVCLNPDAFVNEPIEAELCSLQSPTHRTGDDSDILGSKVGKPGVETRAKGDALLKTFVGETGVRDAKIFGEVMVCLGVAY